jgi:hypothetical protein
MADAFCKTWKKKKCNRRLPVVDPWSKNSCPSHWLFSLARPDLRQRVALPLPRLLPCLYLIFLGLYGQERERVYCSKFWVIQDDSFGASRKSPKKRSREYMVNGHDGRSWRAKSAPCSSQASQRLAGHIVARERKAVHLDYLSKWFVTGSIPPPSASTAKCSGHDRTLGGGQWFSTRRFALPPAPLSLSPTTNNIAVYM